jgi:hypothetical protein
MIQYDESSYHHKPSLFFRMLLLNKNVVLEELTGINCQFCPDGHLRAQQIKDANPGRVILVNIHAGSFAPANPNLKTADGDALNTFFNPTGYPAGSVQRKPHSTDMTRIATGRGNWTSQATAVIGEVSPVNVAMNASIDVATRIVTVNVEMFYTSPFPAGTNHFLNVGMAQNNWEGPQVGSAANPSAHDDGIAGLDAGGRSGCRPCRLVLSQISCDEYDSHRRWDPCCTLGRSSSTA